MSAIAHVCIQPYAHRKLTAKFKNIRNAIKVKKILKS